MEDLNPLVPFYSLALSCTYSKHLVNMHFFSVLAIYHSIFHRMDKKHFFFQYEIAYMYF